MKPSKFQLALIASTDHIFPDLLKNTFPEHLIHDLLKQQDLEHILRYCSQISLYLWNHADPSQESNLDKRLKQRQMEILKFLPISSEGLKCIQEFLAGDSKKFGAPESGIPTFVFDRGQILELVRQMALYGGEFNNGSRDSEDDLLKLLLLCGDEHQKSLSFYTEDDQILKFIESIDAGSHGNHPIGSIGRAKTLIKDIFLKMTIMPSNQSLGQIFELRIGLSFEWYVLCGFACIYMLINRRRIGGNASFSSSEVCTYLPDLAPYFETFVSLLSQTPEELIYKTKKHSLLPKNRSYTIHALRNRPLIRFSDETIAVLDPVCFMESFLTGPVFRLFEPGNQNQDAQRIIGIFGNAFEKYCSSILEQMFPSGEGLTPRTEFNIHLENQKGEIDCCVFYGDTLVVIEYKTGFIPDIARSEGKDFLKAVSNKFIEGKGISQLSKNIKILLESNHFPWCKKMIPILLTYHGELGGPLVNHWFSEEFKKKLMPDSIKEIWMKKGDACISNPIVMTLDDLEGLETSLEGVSMNEILIEFLNKSLNDRILSFHSFLQTTDIYGAKLRANQRLKAASDEEFEKLRRFFIQ
ncbi:MAG: hypothetical protein ACYCQJ_16000 [Nitrososphaerales archaeon]